MRREDAPYVWGIRLSFVYLFIFCFFNDTTAFSYKHQVTYEFCFCVNSLTVMLWNSIRKYADERSPYVVLKWNEQNCVVSETD